jgi:mono/diheme cytochrome c family protein
MSDGVKTESQVTTKRYSKGPETPEMVGGGPMGAQKTLELVGTPEPGGDLASTPATPAAAPVDPKTETRVLPSPIKQPKANCKHCHGRGYEGTYPTTDPATGMQGTGRLICRCLRKKK